MQILKAGGIPPKQAVGKRAGGGDQRRDPHASPRQPRLRTKRNTYRERYTG